MTKLGNIVRQQMKLAAQLEENIIRQELVLAFEQHRAPRALQLPPWGYWDSTIRIINLSAADVDHIYLES